MLPQVSLFQGPEDHLCVPDETSGRKHGVSQRPEHALGDGSPREILDLFVLIYACLTGPCIH